MAGRLARMLPLAAVIGASLTAAGAVPAWLRQSYGDDGTSELTRTGLQVSPALLPLAVVAIAGLVATYAARGPARRVIAALVALTGVGIGVQTVAVLVDPPRTAADPDVGPPVPADLLGPVRVQPLGPVLALAGGALVVLGGLAVLVRKSLRQLGARFDSPVRAEAGPAVVTDDPADADAAVAWWKALDAGADPTSGPPGGRGTGA